jgi:predicted nucleotidyltransferase
MEISHKTGKYIGFYARQEAHKENDIDMLVKFSSSISFRQFVNIQLEYFIRANCDLPLKTLAKKAS